MIGRSAAFDRVLPYLPGLSGVSGLDLVPTPCLRLRLINAGSCTSDGSAKTFYGGDIVAADSRRRSYQD